MNGFHVDSWAFRKALLESERRRIYGVTAFLLVFAVAIVARIVIFGSHMSPWGAVFLLVGVIYEMWTLREIGKALATDRDLPNWHLWFNILAEVAVPVMGVAYFSSTALAVGYRAVATPWVLALFPADYAVCAAAQSAGLPCAWFRIRMRLSRQRFLSGVTAQPPRTI
jgi:hypothetical protein